MSNKSISILILCGFLSISIGMNLIFFDKNQTLKKEILLLNKMIYALIIEIQEQDKEINGNLVYEYRS